MEAGFQCFFGDLRIFCLDFNPEYWQSCCLKHTFKATVIFNLQQLIFQHGHAQFTWLVHKWVAGPFLRSSWVFCGWEVTIELTFKSKDRWSCISWEDEGPGSVSSKIRANVWNMSNISLFTCRPHNSCFTLQLYLPTWRLLSFSPEVAYWVQSWICSTSKWVLRPTPCHWNVLPSALVTQTLWPAISL